MSYEKTVPKDPQLSHQRRCGISEKWAKFISWEVSDKSLIILRTLEVVCWNLDKMAACEVSIKFEAIVNSNKKPQFIFILNLQEFAISVLLIFADVVSNLSKSCGIIWNIWSRTSLKKLFKSWTKSYQNHSVIYMFRDWNPV